MDIQRFFISRHARHLNLHSFPTRRSSDLTMAIAVRPPWANSGAAIATRKGRNTTRGSDIATSLSVFFLHGKEVRRSEEHTSELQSRPHLVCRLLLEKKKNLNIASYVLS